MAFEAQLSPITDDDITARTRRYRSAGIGVCWVSAGSWLPWMEVVPSAWVRAPGDGQRWTVSASVARFDYIAGAWRFVGVELTQFVSWMLAEWLLVHTVRRRYRRIWVEPGKSYIRRQTIWTTPRSIGEENRHEAMRQGQEARKRQREQEQREAEQRQQQEAEAGRAEEQRQREIERAAEMCPLRTGNG